MNTRILLLLIATLSLVFACGDDGDSGKSNNLLNNFNNVNNANNSPNNANNGNDDYAAQRQASDLFAAVMNLTLVNVLASATDFEENGTEGEKPCGGAIGVQEYGTIDLDYADGSTFASFEATASLDGCLAMESGSNPPLEISTSDPSGDGTPDIYRIDGTIAAMTFDDDGFPPVDDEMFPFSPAYDPDAQPTCSNVVLDGVVLEAFAAAPDGEQFTNTDESHNPGGYTEGTITANCGGQTIRCEMDGGTVPLATLSLDAVVGSVGRDIICTYVN